MAESYDAASDARRFLAELFSVADGGYVAATAFQHGGSATRCVPVEQAAEIFDVMAPAIGHADIYVRLTTMRTAPEDGKRGGNEVTLHGLAIPIDLDEKDGWTATLADELFDRLERIGLGPTVRISSGHGWHGYLLFDEPLEHGDHVAILERSKATMVRVAGEVGRTHGITLAVDTKVYDAARVMRLPGTINVKDDTPVQCRSIGDYGRRYGWSDLDENLDPPPEVKPTAKRYAIGGADDPNTGAPGREFNASVDAVDVVLELFPGFHITHEDSDGNVYIARHDRRNHGLVRYADDGHVAIYSATTLREDLRIPAGSVDDKDGPWWPFNLLAIRNFGGDFSAAAKHLTSEGWHGTVYGTRGPTDAPATPEQAAQLAELMQTMFTRPEPPTSHLTLVPDPADIDAEPAPEPEPFQWGDGRIDAGRMLEAFGFELAQEVGQLRQYHAVTLDGGQTIAATVQPDGTVVLGQIATAIMPGAPVGQPIDWRALFQLRLAEDNWQAIWNVVTGPDELPPGLPPLLGRLRDAVEGVAGVGRVEPEAWVWATADEVIKRPKPPATLLARSDNPAAALVYDRRVSIVFGPSETTKTWLCAYAALDCIRRLGKPVAWLDLEEPGNSQGAYRLAQLGATEAEMRMLINLDGFMPELVQVNFGQRTVNTRLRDKLISKLTDSGVGLIVIDSFSELAGSQDLDDNQKPDVTFLRNHLINHLAKVAGVVIIDHTGHSTGAREAGSINKKNAVTGVRLYVDQVKKFGPGHAGEARLWILKDRHKRVYDHCVRQEVSFDGGKTKSAEWLGGVFRLTPVASAERTVSGDEYITARVDAPGSYTAPETVVGPGGGPMPGGRDTADYQMLFELKNRGPFSSQGNAIERMKARFDTGKDRTLRLLSVLEDSGHIEVVDGFRKQYRAVESAWSKDTVMAVDEVGRALKRAARSRRESPE